mgnify:FL=1|tara:strand:- start:41966 stop:43648 length:1683 start_codon:yes stop_codon:yes gene_type:complete
MAQGSKPRHSRSTRKPVTIDLEPEAISKGAATKKDAGATKQTATPGDKPASGAAKPAPVATPDTKNTPVDTPATSSGVAATDKQGSESARKSAIPSIKAGSSDRLESAKKTDSVKNAAPASNAPESAAPAAKTADPGKSASAGTASGKSGSSAKSASGNGGGSGSGRGFGAVGAGLAGGVVAIALYAGLQWGGVLPNLGSGNADSSSADSSSVGATLSADVTAQLDALKQSVAALENSAQSGSESIVEGLEGRIGALETRVESSASGQSGVLPPDLEEKIAGLAAKVESLQASGSNDGSLQLQDKLLAVEKAQNEQATALSGLQASLSELEGAVKSAGQQQTQTLQSLQSRLDAVEKTLSGPREDIKVARAIAAASLKAAIDRGGSFMAELEAFASVDGSNGQDGAAESAAVEQLRTYAASGVPSRSNLLASFPAAADAMIDAANGGNSDAGLVDRLLNSATSLVKIRPVGDVSGDSVQAIVARMESRLANGDLQGALNEWKTLPEKARSASAGFSKNLEARIEVEKLVTGTLSAALPTSPVNAGSQTQPAQQTDAGSQN